MSDSAKILKANAFLLMAAIVWGLTFIFQKKAMINLSPAYYSGLRFLLGGLCLAPFAFFRAQKVLRGSVSWATVVGHWTGGGLLLGAFLCGGILLQQFGLDHAETTAGKAGFITGLYVVFVPLLYRLSGNRIELGVLAGLGLAVVGLYFLGVKADAPLGLSMGDWLILIGALVWAFHVMAVGWLAPKLDVLVLAAGQAVVCGLFSIIIAVIFEAPPTMAGIMDSWLDIAWGGAMSVAVGFTFQVVGQKHAPPVSAAIIMQLETVVALLAGIIFLQEELTARMGLGALLMFIGMMIAQLYPIWSANKKYRALENVRSPHPLNEESTLVEAGKSEVK